LFDTRGKKETEDEAKKFFASRRLCNKIPQELCALRG
jgi:hypothetical protein